MTAEIVPLSSSNPWPTTDDSVAIVACELLAQHGSKAVDVIGGWAASGRAGSYATDFWRKVADEIRRTAGRDRQKISATGRR